MDKITLKTQSRNIEEEKAADLRREDLLPIECYGNKIDNLHLKANYQDFRHAYLEAGESALIDLEIEGKDSVKTLVNNVQLDPVSGKIIHVDLTVVDMHEKITTHIPLVFEGEAPAIEAEGGVMNTSKDNLEVRCLPGDLVHEIKVDVSGLEHVNDSLTVADIKVPDTIEVLDDEDLSVVSIVAHIEEPEEPEVVEGAEGEEGEGEEGAEGEGEGESKEDSEEKDDKKE